MNVHEMSAHRTDQMVGEYHHMRVLLGHDRAVSRVADAYGFDKGSVIRALSRNSHQQVLGDVA